jgi:putative ABC transport system substrate-binding protein
MPSINDPVGAKLVASLARPGGNTTGVATLADDVTPKLIDLMREIAPQVQQAAMIVNPDNSSNYKHLESARTAAGRVGVRIDGFELRNMGQLEAVFAAMQSRGVRAVLVARDAALLDLRAELCALAVKHRMPLIGPQPEYGEAGALVGYGASARDNYRRAAVYIKRILAGAKPADLPVEQPQRVVLTVNARTAKALGIAVPGTVLVRADHVVQ